MKENKSGTSSILLKVIQESIEMYQKAAEESWRLFQNTSGKEADHHLWYYNRMQCRISEDEEILRRYMEELEKCAQ
ncbi:MAG: hypothetical protein IIZ98_00295 [Erysipelotrichaceae bacterium]|nr:hypothetical protein [Erysipelotrichaceae bacterium]